MAWTSSFRHQGLVLLLPLLHHEPLRLLDVLYKREYMRGERKGRKICEQDREKRKERRKEGAKRVRWKCIKRDLRVNWWSKRRKGIRESKKGNKDWLILWRKNRKYANKIGRRGKEGREGEGSQMKVYKERFKSHLMEKTKERNQRG